MMHDSLIVPYKKIGILGGGQLAKMLALAAHPMHIKTHCYETSSACASLVTDFTVGDFDDKKKLQTWINQCDVLTFESENIPVNTLDFIAKQALIFPHQHALAISQDRLLEKNYLRALAIPTANYYAIDSLLNVEKIIQDIGFPVVLKSRRLGYDGKGQAVIRCKNDIVPAWEKLNKHALILEQWLTYTTEVSQIAVRDDKANMRFYPLTENNHEDGILRISRAPYCDMQLTALAQTYTRKIAESFNYVGVMTVEFFVVNQQLMVNEIAPRVHNSGHWTIEGAVTSQFENHIRAICGLPLGDTDAKGFSAMMNCIGVAPLPEKILAIPGAHYHWYGKTVKPARKVGHVTLVADNKNELENKISQMVDLIPVKI